MAKSMMRWLVVVVFLTVLVSRFANGVIQCKDAVSKVVPCETFLLSGDSTPSVECCTSAQALDKIAMASQPDRKAICECFKDTAKSFPVNLEKARKLPDLCKLNIKVVIDPNIDCDRYIFFLNL
ncbi:Non-specific lipid-transfer protein 8 [Forsythia ovata]|uniref:Non-specific lipid-transfer protein 8 n=1 Tax=Forsythia ovata TaxID=205694 RepID=A0ABD1S4P9_9LAMI